MRSLPLLLVLASPVAVATWCGLQQPVLTRKARFAWPAVACTASPPPSALALVQGAYSTRDATDPQRSPETESQRALVREFYETV